MKMKDALAIIERTDGGFRVHFEEAKDGMLRAGYFPERDEALIRGENDAWILARKFAGKTRCRFVNIYVVDSESRPVSGYKDKMIVNR
ncbi:MAG: hypothetical protein JKY89_13280 [Immundisolibacteraceae bacterium]|nr:hypothetical protein [Immundisolibacteraceae bacterium]